MSKHTKGPWDRIIADGYTVRHPQIYSDKGPVANATWLGDGRIDELNANARLIASAPDLLKQRDELLEVVREFVQTMDSLPDSNETSLRVWDVYDTASKLIEKMQRGES